MDEMANSEKVDENATTGKISLGLSTIVRVTLKDGTFHEVRGNFRLLSNVLNLPGHRLWTYREL